MNAVVSGSVTLEGYTVDTFGDNETTVFGPCLEQRNQDPALLVHAHPHRAGVGRTGAPRTRRCSGSLSRGFSALHRSASAEGGALQTIRAWRLSLYVVLDSCTRRVKVNGCLLFPDAGGRQMASTLHQSDTPDYVLPRSQRTSVLPRASAAAGLDTCPILSD